VTEKAAARERLAGEQSSALERLAGLERDFASIVESSSAGNDDEHDPEGATIAFERQHVASLLAQTREYLAEIDKALQRLDVGTYGLCENCGQSIAPDRLAARPTAPTCINCAARR
jgi:DnaK suppressor protein